MSLDAPGLEIAPEDNHDKFVLRPVETNELAVNVKNITIAYRSYKERPATIKETVLACIKHRKLRYYSTFNALQDVSFSVHKGEVFGIIGSNGAGKSTLLKTICGVLPPSSGSLTVRGTIDSLIQLGAGFDADLNAVENIFLNSSLHKKGYAEIKDRVPHILQFAELEEFASTPIRYYSSGMYARLGFSVAIDRKPDILIVDEILGVGDERFNRKCKDVFYKFIENGSTIIVVSHSMKMIESICHRVGVLSKGRLIYIGDPKSAVEVYRDQNYETALANKEKKKNV